MKNDMSFLKTRTLHARIKLARAYARREYIKAHNGHELPTWLEIHHVDFCPLNNDPGNWKCIPKNEHLAIHAEYGDKKRSRAALHAYLDLELDLELNNLDSWLTIYNTGFN
jgi:hypothetical protein